MIDFGISNPALRLYKHFRAHRFADEETLLLLGVSKPSLSFRKGDLCQSSDKPILAVLKSSATEEQLAGRYVQVFEIKAMRKVLKDVRALSSSN